ncbi:MAG: hypothetical protein ACE14V_11760 [bacterium]
MKRFIIIILVLIVIGIGFYFGYRHQRNNRNTPEGTEVKIPSVVPQQSIGIQYTEVADQEIENNHSKGFSQLSYDSTNNDILIYKGRGTLVTILLCIPHKSDENIHFSVPRKPGEKVYEFTLSYNRNESAEELFSRLGPEFGFKAQLTAESTETRYTANTDNFKNLLPRPSEDFKPEITNEGTIYQFRNVTSGDIILKFMEVYRLRDVAYIPRTGGGIFNVDINMPTTMEEAISDIREKTGIEIGTEQIKSKTFTITRL